MGMRGKNVPRKKEQVMKIQILVIALSILLGAVIGGIIMYSPPADEDAAEKQLKTQPADDLNSPYKKIFDLKFDDKSWSSMQNYRSFSPDSLYDEINGGAEVFIDYHFVRLAKMDFVYSKDEKSDTFVVELYDQRDPLSAYGMVSYELDANSAMVEVGQLANSGGTSLVFWQGKYYIKIYTYSEGLENRLVDLGKTLAGTIESGPDKFEELEVFNAPDLVKNSKKYHPVNYLGLKELSEIYSGNYTFGETELILFYRTCENEEQAEKFYKAIVDLGKKNQSLKKDESSGQGARLEIEDEFDGKMVVSRSGAKLVGIRGEIPAEKANERISRFMERI
jgi:hypothetical protein